jgi:sulfite exporter TauE/SafE
LLIMLIFFGPIISMLFFSVLVGFLLKRQSKRTVVLFSVIFVFCIYFVFIKLLKMPFEMGLVEKMIRGF